MVKLKLIILLLCYSSLGFSQSPSVKDTLVDLETINLRMDNDDFQFMCLQDALKVDSLEVYELYITPKYCNYDITQDIMKSVCTFRNLRILIIRDIDIYSFPKDFQNLKKLQGLYLLNIRLDSLPNEIGELINLREIEIMLDKNLKKLPNSIGNLNKLERLCVPDVNELPLSICNLKNIKSITSHSTNILEEPLFSCLKYMENLIYIQVLGSAFNKQKIQFIEKENGDLIKVRY